MAAPFSPPMAPSEDELGLASWEPHDLADIVLPAWADFLALAAELDLDGPTRLDGWSARQVCVHLGSWPGSRTLDRMREEAESDAADDWSDHRGASFDQDAHNEAVLAARGRAPRVDVLAALQESREQVTRFLDSADAGRLGRRPVRSVLGPLPLSTLVAAGTYELAVHALDLAPAGARNPSARLLDAGVAALVDTTGALAARCGLVAGAGAMSPEGGWAFASAPGAWTTLGLPTVPSGWPTVQGRSADLLDASAGRRAVPPMLARRDLRLQHVSGLLALAPIVEEVPGLPGGTALRAVVFGLRGLSRLVRGLPGVPTDRSCG